MQTWFEGIKSGVEEMASGFGGMTFGPEGIVSGSEGTGSLTSKAHRPAGTDAGSRC